MMTNLLLLVAGSILVNWTPVSCVCPGTQRYQTTFIGDWGPGSPFSLNRPTDGAGLTELIYVVHNASFNIFKAGVLATSGLQLYANSTARPTNIAPLIAEIDAAITSGLVLQKYVLASGARVITSLYEPATDNGARRGVIVADGAYPYVSIIGRILPSGDLFVGLDSFSLCNSSTWKPTAAAPVQPFSAGTRMNNKFTFNGAFINPAQPVSQIVCNTTNQTVFCNTSYPASLGDPFMGFFTFGATTPECAGSKTYTVSVVSFWGPQNFLFNQAIGYRGLGPFTVDQFITFFDNTTVISDSRGALFAQDFAGSPFLVPPLPGIIDGFARAQFHQGRMTQLPPALLKGKSAFFIETRDNIIADGAHTTMEFILGLRRSEFAQNVPYFGFGYGQTSSLCHSGSLGGAGGDLLVYQTGNYTYSSVTKTATSVGTPQPFIQASCGGILSAFCSGSQTMAPIGYIVAFPKSIECNATGGSLFRVTFRGLWTSSSFPVAFPSAKQFFSPIVGVSHSSVFTLFASGQNATTGLKNVAETGNATVLLSELKTARDSFGTVLSFAASSDGPTVSGTGMMTLDLYVDSAHPYISLVTMLAPSPDWFAGVTINTCSGATIGTNFKSMMNAYDAGTDSGTTFTSPNNATIPPVPVFALQCGEGVFCSGTGPVQGVGMVTLASQAVSPALFGSFTMCVGLKTYRVTLNSSWQANAPLGFPSNGRMESLIVVSMTPGTNPLFASGTASTSAFGNWSANASSANVDALLASLNGLSNNNVLVAVANKGSANADGSNTISVDITVDPAHTSIAIASRFSSSPDWFLGVQMENLCQSPSYKSPFTVTGAIYDAGVRNGTSFSFPPNSLVVQSNNIAPIACGQAFCASGNVPSVATIEIGVQPVQTFGPTRTPTTSSPSKFPTSFPTGTPVTSGPSKNPTQNPTRNPTKNPTQNPTKNPTKNPTSNPTKNPSKNPTKNPSKMPTANPTTNPTRNPSANPTLFPSSTPTTSAPSTTSIPTSNPTSNPTKNPSKNPTQNPTKNPTKNPTRTVYTFPCNILDKDFIDIQTGTTAANRVRAYASHNNTHYRMVMSGPTNVWFGVGFGTSGKMQNSQALIYSGSGTVQLYDLIVSPRRGETPFPTTKQPLVLSTATLGGARRVCVVGVIGDTPKNLNTDQTQAIWAKGNSMDLAVTHGSTSSSRSATPVSFTVVNGTNRNASSAYSNFRLCGMVKAFVLTTVLWLL